MAESPAAGSTSSSSPPPSTALIDRTLHALGFQFTLISPTKVTGRLKVTETCCQSFNVLSGGVSALMAETLASLGAYVASDFRRVAGVQLCTNHIKAAPLGEEVEVEAKPIQVGRTIQVWEVQTRKIDPSTSGSNILLSTSKVTLLCYRQAPHASNYEETIRKYAKL
ncbi:1,4-dihydroxy-2-naphthoyl-CoA thioesterase 1-like isoform X2 [Canna indica]|uniref:1,4-dihydroxy-2-naphthoyl-CoA thioesterase 1-like isoform X2 n=1 Tax=Canna indica TaxID=4628 RepID=A0AAQ3KX40_9LILI|nr:1,4-dihydroxy-2-naphthoyl-CoA thioesterase 1-like isoform X2 [Canna indica]